MISWTLLLFLLILIFPLLGAILALLLGRFLPKRAGILIAALPFFLASIAILFLTQSPLFGQDLGQPLSPTQSTVAALQMAPTSRWVQPPRTLKIVSPLLLTTTLTPTVAPTPTPTPHPYSLVTVAVRNGSGESGLATRTARRLEAQGFRVLAVEDDPQTGNRPHTLILDRGDHAEVRLALAKFLNVGLDYVQTNSNEESKADIILILGDDFEQLANMTPTPTQASVEPQPTATPNPLSAASIIVRNATIGRPGLAGRVADRLRALGFHVLDTENDEQGPRDHTMILDRGDHAEVRQALAKSLKVAEENVQIDIAESSEADIIVVLGDDYEE